MLVNKLVCDKCNTINDNDAKFCKNCGAKGEGESTKRKFFDDEVTQKAKQSFEEYIFGTNNKCKTCGGILLGSYCGKCDLQVFTNDLFKN